MKDEKTATANGDLNEEIVYGVLFQSFLHFGNGA